MTQPYPPQQPRPVVVQHSRNTLIAYLLWFFLGHLGVHRMYTGRWGTGVAQLLLCWVGAATTWILIGWIPLGIWGLWWLVDAFLLPGLVRSANRRSAERAWSAAPTRTF